MTSNKVRGDGIDLAVRTQGDPAHPALLLVHGYPDTHTVWDGVAAALQDRFYVIRYDVRGSGASDRPKGRRAYRFEHLMADLKAVLDDTAPGRKVHLAGHDWGSIQSWEAVTTMPERFASYTSISGPCLDHVGRWSRAKARSNPFQGLSQALHSWYIGFFQLPLLPELTWRSGLGAKVLARAEGLTGREHFAPTLRADAAAGVGLYRANMVPRLLRPKERTTDVPVQVVIPDRDPFVTPELPLSARPFVKELTVSPLSARHWCPVTHPAELARLIAAHIDRQG
ncbi:hypothetical protein GCM10027589_38280 [Actinocorallia lasiicapitis]